MRCKKHRTDLSSSVGICASCLRQRLFALIAAQAQHQQQTQLHSRASAAFDDSRKSDSHPPPLVFPRSVSPYVTRRKSDSHPPPLVFPRSVSPYVTRRKSDGSSWSHHLRFYTPQVGPTSNSYSDSTATATSTSKKKHTRLSLFSSLFGSRSEKFHPDPASRDWKDASPSWFSSIFSGRRKQQSRLFSTDYSSTAGRQPGRKIDRGMSPARGADSDEDCDHSPSRSGYSSESSQGWKRTPAAPSSVRRGKPVHGKNMSGLAFCLSPLVRASPNGHWNQKGGLPPDKGLSGEIRGPVKPHLSNAASFCANRSRKVADFGRVNHKR